MNMNCQSMQRLGRCDKEQIQKKLSTANQEIGRMREALETGIKWMEFWLGENLCECECGHTCGKTERQKELAFMKSALSQSQPAPADTGNHEPASNGCVFCGLTKEAGHSAECPQFKPIIVTADTGKEELE